MISTYKVFLMVREIEVKKFKYIYTYMYNHTYISHTYEIHNKCLISMGEKTSVCEVRGKTKAF